MYNNYLHLQLNVGLHFNLSTAKSFPCSRFKEFSEGYWAFKSNVVDPLLMCICRFLLLSKLGNKKLEGRME